MSRVFWDTMLLVYMLDNNPMYGEQTRTLLSRCFQRNDQLVTSYLALGEALTGMPDSSDRSASAVSTLEEMGFMFVPFDEGCVSPFRKLRKDHALRGPDAMHLACAAANQVDLFLTGDKQLLKQNLHVPGIHFIASFEHAPL